MRLGVLFSGGKDSTYALWKAMQIKGYKVVCLVTISSKNEESFMFHTPNISLAKLQAEAIGLPLIEVVTKGKKERELSDLKKALLFAKEKYAIEGVVTGAIESVYQAERVQRICDKLALWCFNPLWKKDQVELVQEVIASGFDVVVSGVFAYPLKSNFAGRKLDDQLLKDLVVLNERFNISPSGEGGELETTVLDAPFFKKRIEITDKLLRGNGNSFLFEIKNARLVKK